MANRRIKSRLEKLEKSSSGVDLSNEAERLLVSLLGRFDALWWPFRTHIGNYRAEVQRLQHEYLAGTGAMRAAAQGESNWKSGHHARNELTTAGLCGADLAGGQITGLRLTAKGISDARAMVGDRLKRLDNEVTSLIYQALQQAPTCDHSGPWVVENRLFGNSVVCTDNPSDWNHATEYLLPLLSCGAVKSCSDLWNRVYYLPTDIDLPTEPVATTTEQPWADYAYLTAFDSERRALQKLDCQDGGIVIPMRCT